MSVYSCSNCGKSCIPLWRALAITTFSPPMFCPCCNARLIRKRRAADLLVAAPLAIAIAAVHHWGIREATFVWFFFSFAALSGISLWLHFVVFETVDVQRVSCSGRRKGSKC